MPMLALIITDPHNEEAIFAALPAGTVYTALTLTTAEWAKDPARIASEYGMPIIARTQQEWNKQPRP